MAELLTAVRTRRLSSSETVLDPGRKPGATPRDDMSIRSTEDATEVLLSKPDLNTLTTCLRWLTKNAVNKSQFSISVPGPKAARIINIIVTETIPNFWPLLQTEDHPENTKRRRLLLGCLANVAGMGAIVIQLRFQITAFKDLGEKNNDGVTRSTILQSIQDLLDVLGSLIERDDFTDRTRTDISQSIERPAQRRMIWKELVSLLAYGKLLSTAAEANTICNDLSVDVRKDSWVGNGSVFSAWLGRNIQYMVLHQTRNNSERIEATTLLFSKALTLGYTDHVVEAILGNTLGGSDEKLPQLRPLVQALANHEQRTVLYAILRIVAKTSPPARDNAKRIAGIAALLRSFVEDSPYLLEALLDWLTSLEGGAAGSNSATRRAAVATLSMFTNIRQKAFTTALKHFGDKLYIKHTPVLNQEINCEVLLLLAGRMHSLNIEHLRQTSQSSLYINAISNRLAASSSRSRFLGMVVGVAVSDLVDAKDKKMTFDSEEVNSEDGKWYRSLPKMVDRVGLIGDLKVPVVADSTTKRPQEQAQKIKVTQDFKPASISKIVSVEEVDDSSDDEDLPMYEKPDSDAEDSEDDPTLIQRDKPTAPVYILDLIAGLRDIENYDRHRLAITTASTLIRRKTNFGTEVKDHIEELATQLVGLNDKYNLEKFQEMRLRAMIAVLVAQPLEMGQWFCRTYFNGEYSMGQRAAILTTLGLGARELAGYREEDAALTGATVPQQELFPSKRLPEKYHKMYSIDAAPVNSLARKLERTILRPLANEAADKIIGPNILKVRTFSSRMEVEKKRKRPITNQLAKVVADGFFFPLTGLWRVQAKTRGENNVFSQPFLLSHFLKTLSLILNASGASTLSLPALTTEFWSLLLSLRIAAQDAPPVLEALLFSFLTLLEINNDNQRDLAQDHSKELLETQAWVEQIFENVRGGSEEGDRIRMLAAGVLVKTREVVEKYQRLLLGDLVNFV